MTASWFKRKLKADRCRIKRVGEKLFMQIGFKRDTRDNRTGFWTDEKGEVKHFVYVEWQTIANGKDRHELTESAMRYLRVSKMTMEQFLRSKEFLEVKL